MTKMKTKKVTLYGNGKSDPDTYDREANYGEVISYGTAARIRKHHELRLEQSFRTLDDIEFANFTATHCIASALDVGTKCATAAQVLPGARQEFAEIGKAHFRNINAIMQGKNLMRDDYYDDYYDDGDYIQDEFYQEGENQC